MKTQAYKLKKGINLKNFRKAYGFDNLPDSIAHGANVLFKVQIVDLDSQPSQLVQEILNDPKYTEALAAQGIKLSDKFEFETIYDEEGNEKNSLVLNDFAKGFCTTWRLEVKYGRGGERILEFTAGDMNFPYSFIATNVLDEYCNDEICILKEKGLIEEVEYSDER